MPKITRKEIKKTLQRATRLEHSGRSDAAQAIRDSVTSTTATVYAAIIDSKINQHVTETPAASQGSTTVAAPVPSKAGTTPQNPNLDFKHLPATAAPAQPKADGKTSSADTKLATSSNTGATATAAAPADVKTDAVVMLSKATQKMLGFNLLRSLLERTSFHSDEASTMDNLFLNLGVQFTSALNHTAFNGTLESLARVAATLGQLVYNNRGCFFIAKYRPQLTLGKSINWDTPPSSNLQHANLTVFFSQIVVNELKNENNRRLIMAMTLEQLAPIVAHNKLQTSLFQTKEIYMPASTFSPAFGARLIKYRAPSDAKALYTLDTFDKQATIPTLINADVAEQLKQRAFVAAHNTCPPEAQRALHDHLVTLLTEYDALAKKLSPDCQQYVEKEYFGDYISSKPCAEQAEQSHSMRP